LPFVAGCHALRGLSAALLGDLSNGEHAMAGLVIDILLGSAFVTEIVIATAR